MDTFLQFLITTPFATTIVILLLITLIAMFVIAFVQGREVSLGPLKIGSKNETRGSYRGLARDDLDGASNVISFSSRTDYVTYRANRLRVAQKINDVTWRFQGYSGQTFSHGEVTARRNEFKLISQILKRPDVIWRGVGVFNSLERFMEEKSLITDLENVGYNFGIYEADSRSSPPRVGFMIIDDKELLIAYPHKDIRLAIQHPEIVKLYSEYFEDIWQLSYKLKQGNKVDFQKLEDLERQLTM